MILEGIVTTLNPDGSANVSPMGPRVSDDMSEITLRPYKTSRTFRNLKLHGEGVFHVTDDVELLARAAVGEVHPNLAPAHRVRGFYLTGACRFYEFRVTEVEELDERATLRTEVLHRETLRDFFGFHRARHAVLEAAILATRTQWIPAAEILRQFDALEVLVQKTGSEREHRAFAFLRRHVELQVDSVESAERSLPSPETAPGDAGGAR
jgi:hypothetical protein